MTRKGLRIENSLNPPSTPDSLHRGDGHPMHGHRRRQTRVSRDVADSLSIKRGQHDGAGAAPALAAAKLGPGQAQGTAEVGQQGRRGIGGRI